MKHTRTAAGRRSVRKRRRSCAACCASGPVSSPPYTAPMQDCIYVGDHTLVKRIAFAAAGLRVKHGGKRICGEASPN